MKYITAVPVTTAVILKIEEAKAFFHLGGFWRKPTAGGAWSGTISTHQQELNLRTWALANGWNGTSAATITIASGVYIWSDNTATPALTINGSWPGGITLVNNGYIMGKGGKGGCSLPGENGGPAISISLNTVINTLSGYIGGGGAGGGAGGNYGAAIGGVGGAIGNVGGSGYYDIMNCGWYGAGGGRVFPGSGGAGGTDANLGGGGVAAQGGGAGGGGAVLSTLAGPAVGGAGGSAGNVGGVSSGNVLYGAGGGGGWGAVGGNSSGTGGTMTAAGSGGKAVALNGNTVTWLGGYPARVFGSVS